MARLPDGQTRCFVRGTGAAVVARLRQSLITLACFSTIHCNILNSYDLLSATRADFDAGARKLKAPGRRGMAWFALLHRRHVIVSRHIVTMLGHLVADTAS
jgi:hypothetical protein